MMQTQEIEVDGNHKPFIQKLGKTLIFLSSFYWIEVTILGPQFELYIVFGTLLSLFGFTSFICSLLLMICGLPLGLLSMSHGKSESAIVAH